MVTKEMRMFEILDMDDRINKILLDYGLNCQGCPGAKYGTLEEAAKGHSLDFEKLLEELNRTEEE